MSTQHNVILLFRAGFHNYYPRRNENPTGTADPGASAGVRLALAVTMPKEKRSPSPQPSPRGEGAAFAALGEVTDQWTIRQPQNVLPLPLGEGRGEGARAIELPRYGLLLVYFPTSCQTAAGGPSRAADESGKVSSPAGAGSVLPGGKDRTALWKNFRTHAWPGASWPWP